MRHFTKKMFVFCLAAALAILPVVSCYAADANTNTANMKAVDEEAPSASAMAADLVVARPLGIASTVLGCAVFIASLPFSLPGGNVKKVFKTTVVKPAAFTFKRPLGEFD